MKSLFYHVFALMFNLSRIFPVKERRAAFISMHNEALHDSLGAVAEELSHRGFETVLLSRRDLDLHTAGLSGALRFFFVQSRKLATAKYVFLNDNFMPLGQLHFRRDVVVTQLWHAEGVFKKFGLAIAQPADVRSHEIAGNRKLTYVVCSSKSVAPYYAEAFGVAEDQVLPLGAPRADVLLQSGAAGRAREALDRYCPALAGKTLILYAPTFRGSAEADAALLQQLDVAAFERRFPNAVLLVRLHPQIHPEQRVLPGAVDVTEFDDVCALVLACDALITDYSSICMDFALLQKKTVFFAFDLAAYTAARDFYFDYTAYVPGAVATTFDAVLDALGAPQETEKAERFCAFNFDFKDTDNTKRVCDAICEKQ